MRVAKNSVANTDFTKKNISIIKLYFSVFAYGFYVGVRCPLAALLQSDRDGNDHILNLKKSPELVSEV